MGFITNITNATPTTGTFYDGQPSGMDNDGGSIMGPIWGGEVFATTPYVNAVAFGPADAPITVLSVISRVFPDGVTVVNPVTFKISPLVAAPFGAVIICTI